MKTPKKTVLITGASAGIGAATAIMAARRGYDIAVHYRSDARAAQLVAHMAEEAGAKTTVLHADIAKPDEINKMFEKLDDSFDRLDVLVNNAGVVDAAARLDEMSPERIEQIMRVNLIGTMLVAKEAVLRMSQSYGGDGGVIINLSSAAARLGAPNEYIDYAASKGGLDTFTKGLALEVAREGIRVAGIRPGIIETAIHAKGGDPGRAERLANTVPLGRSGTAEECAEAIIYLMSEQASYVTGSILDVAGGR